MVTVISNISELVTLEPLATEKRLTSISQGDLGLRKNGWLACGDGRVLATGSGPVPTKYSGGQVVDARGGLVLPGLVDAHTHPLFAGSRADEFCARLGGATYQEIARRGGGIQATVRSTREADEADLRQCLTQRLDRFLQLGVTTVEAKSGYGLSAPEELRHLRLLKAIKANRKQELVITCLALHAVPREFPSAKAYAQAMADDLLPAVAREQLADSVDAFVENGYFSAEDVRSYLKTAAALGLKIRLHADEFSDSGGAALSASVKALSADHLQYASSSGIAAMAANGVVAVLLPGTSLYAKIPFAEARRFTQAGCPIALATDFNPGSCLVDNLPMMVTVGALHCGLTPPEAVAAVTYVAAAALGLAERKGALLSGFDADFVISPLSSCEEFVADLGRTQPKEVWIKGTRVL